MVQLSRPLTLLNVELKSRYLHVTSGVPRLVEAVFTCDNVADLVVIHESKTSTVIQNECVQKYHSWLQNYVARAAQF